MQQELPNISLQEQDLELFLAALGIKIPPPDLTRKDGHAIIALSAPTAAFLDARDSRALVLCYRHCGMVYPLSLLFLRGVENITFCHSTLLIESYTDGPHIAEILRGALQRFFARDADRLLATLEPTWVGLSLAGHLDCRIMWDIKPELPIVAALMQAKFGEVREIPCFPGVYYYNNPYEENILEVALPELNGDGEILVLGCGAGLEPICVALQYGVPVDATDINPCAIANTRVAARRAGVSDLVTAWVSNGFGAVRKRYDAILFEAPLAIDKPEVDDPNRYDMGGKILKSVLATLPSFLNPGGRLFLMSRPDLTPYISLKSVRWRMRRNFVAKSSVAIHEVWCE